MIGVRTAAVVFLLALGTAAQPRAGEGRRPREGSPPGAARAQAAGLPAGIRVTGDIEYARVGEIVLRLDLYGPEKAAGPLPVILWIHGGGWKAGSRRQRNPPMALLRTNPSFAVASIDYRLSGTAVFPAQIEDCRAAVRWLRANAARHNLDPDRIGAWGSSAGGHLAALLGTSGSVRDFDTGANLDVSGRVQAVCDYYGPTDLVAMAMTPGYERHAKADSAESALVGGAVLEKRELATKASPLTYVDAKAPPFLIAHGDGDRVVPPAQSRLLHEALCRAGVPSELHIVAGAGHGGPEFVAAGLIAKVSAFFERTLRARPAAPAQPGSAGEQAPAAGDTGASAVQPVPAAAAAAAAAPGAGGLLFFASYAARDNTAAIANPHIAGALFTVYWSPVEKQPGAFDWKELDARIRPWIAGGKKVALRIMWSSSGTWPDPAARRPTPQWVLDKGAVAVTSVKTGTVVPLVWDPVYREAAMRFVREVARRYDGDPAVLFIDATPGAETNPYRYRRLNQVEPDFKARFLAAAASDGRKYSDALWLETLKSWVDDLAGSFKKTRVLVTLNTASLDGPSQMKAVGDHCVAWGCMVGQNGLTGRSYAADGGGKGNFEEWGRKAPLYFEMLDASGGNTGTLAEVMKAAERIGCDYLGVYAADVLRGTPGQAGYDPAFEEALRYGARAIAGHAQTAAPPAGAPAPASAPAAVPAGLRIDGERWTWTRPDGNVSGILVRPEGAGPFPAVIISHGRGGSAVQFSLAKARTMAGWGLVCIGPDFTHAGRGAARDQGASAENVRRATVCVEALRALGYVDGQRIYAYGNSMGAFVTIALAADRPGLLKAAAITAGGVSEADGWPAPSAQRAGKVVTPLCILHGSADTTVRPEQSEKLKRVLDANGIAVERKLFPGVGHGLHQEREKEVLEAIRAWFRRYGLDGDGDASRAADRR